MSRLVRSYIRWVDRVNRRIGRIAMYLIFVLVGVLLWSTLSKVFAFSIEGYRPSNWTLETAQFVMVAYYILGGPYSIQLGSNVRMDLFYGSWSVKTKAWFDAFTIFFLLYYLVVLFHGGVQSTAYSLGYFGTESYTFFKDLIVAFVTGGMEGVREITGHLERSATAWRPYLWPIKFILCFGILLMILQALAEFFKDIIRIRGGEI